MAHIGGTAGSLTATSGGVWAAIRTGMHGFDALYRARGLSQVSYDARPDAPEQVGPPTLNGNFDNGVTVRSFGRSIWLTSLYGMSCDNPTTGHFVAGTTFSGKNFAVFGDWEGRLYGTTGEETPYTTVAEMKPPAPCGA